MSKKQERFVMEIVRGYMRQNWDKWTPHIIIHWIIQYYNVLTNTIPCNVYDISKWTDIIKNNDIVNVFVNHKTIFYITNKNKLYCQLDKNVSYNDEFIESINGINIISTGLRNSTFCYISTMDNKLYKMNRSNTAGKSKLEPVLQKYKFHSVLIQIDCGKNHSLFLDSKGIMYGSGKNDKNQLSIQYKSINEDIYQYRYSNIKKISCGQYAGYFINAGDVLHSFGSNYCGQLGINSHDKVGDGIINIVKHKITHLGTGSGHVLIRNNKNELYGFGYNVYGQCGLLGQSYVLKPKLIHVPTNENIINIKCGIYNSFIKTESKWYSFGDNNSHILLLQQNSITWAIAEPTEIDFKYISNFTGNNNEIIDIYPGLRNTFILQKS